MIPWDWARKESRIESKGLFADRATGNRGSGNTTPPSLSPSRAGELATPPAGRRSLPGCPRGARENPRRLKGLPAGGAGEQS